MRKFLGSLVATILLAAYAAPSLAANNWFAGYAWHSTQSAAWNAFLNWQYAHYGPCGGWGYLYKGIFAQSAAQTEYHYDWSRNDPGCSHEIIADGGPAFYHYVCNDGYEWDDSAHSCLAGYYLAYTPITDSTPCPNSCDKSNARQGVPAAGEPINLANGNETESETDYQSADGRLKFIRTYNSLMTTVNTGIGQNWQHNFAARITKAQDVLFPPPTARFAASVYSSPSTACTSGWPQIASSVPGSSGVTATFASGSCQLSNGKTLSVFSTATNSAWDGSGDTAAMAAHRPDGSVYPFRCSAGVCTPDADIPVKLSASSSGYVLTDEDDSTKVYSSAGALQSVTDRAGYQQTFTYTNGQLSSVTDSFGRSLVFDYDGTNLVMLTTPSGQIHYGYDSGRLVSVTYPDNTARTFIYDDARFPAALTGVVDERGTRYQSWSYDTQGSAYSNTFAGGLRSILVDYTDVMNPQVTDAFGTTRTYHLQTVNTRQKLMSISGASCNSCGFPAAVTYDSAGYFATTTDWNGNSTHYTYDSARGLLTSRTDAYGTPRARTVSFSWHPTLRVPATVTEPGRTTTFTYDAVGNPLTRTVTDTTASPNQSRVWTYTYDSFGRVLMEDGPRTDVSDVTTYTYYICNSGYQCGQLQTITDALGHITTFNTYNASGQPLTITDPNGQVTTLTYDGRQRVTSEQYGSELTTVQYWPTGLVRKVTLPDGAYLLYKYNDGHELTSIEDAEGNHVEFTLDAMGNRIAENTYDASGALSRARSRTFDALNRLWKDVASAGTPDVTTTFQYDSNGNLTSAAAPLSRTTLSEYDELDRVKKITDPLTAVTTLAYDAAGNVASVTDPRNLTTSYTYDGFGELIQEISPDSGTTSYTYDEAGNVHSSTDARGITGTFTYDALNRRTSSSYPDQALSLTYDSGGNGVGHLTSAVDASHSMAWSYDTQGRVAGMTQQVGGLMRSVSYGYQNGNLTSITTPSGQAISYSYANGRISQVAVNGLPLITDVIYDPFGPPRQWTWANGTLAVRGFDLDGQLNQLDIGGEYVEYSYDDAKRPQGIENFNDPSLSWTFGYDASDHLTNASSTPRTDNWSYDSTGNRLTESGSIGGQSYSSTYTIDSARNRVASVAGSHANTYGYDAAGNLTTETGAARPTSLASTSTVSYSYNALGQRVWKSGPAGPVYFVYDEMGHLLGEYGSGGALIQETVWFDDLPVATIRPKIGGGVEVFYIHTDQLGTPRKVSRPRDNVVMWRWDSGAFGTGLPNENPEGAGTFEYNLRFPGQYFDGESGLHYNYFRDYDPVTGRYLESDPIGLYGGINTYAYVGGNPLSRVDPAGLQEIALPVPWELPGVRPIVPPGTIDPIMPIVPPEADAEDPSDVGDEATTDEMRQCPRDCRGYLKQLRKHQEKLRLYRLNPDAYDNLGFLKGADALGLSALREQIIQRRIRNLEKQIENFKRLYERCMANNPMA